MNEPQKSPYRPVLVRCIECGKKGTHRVCDACFDPQKVYVGPSQNEHPVATDSLDSQTSG